MATRSFSPSSSTSSSRSSSVHETVSQRDRNVSETSREVTVNEPNLREGSVTNTVDAISIADTATIRTASPTASHGSTTATGTAYDSISIATTNNTGVTNDTNTPQQPPIVGGIPIIRPPVLKQQQQSGTGIGVFGPQRPTGYPTQPPPVAPGVIHQQPIQVDVAAAHQQYQQRAVQPDISPYSGSTTSSSGGSLSSPGTASIQQQPRSDATKTTVNQGDFRQAGSANSGQFRQQTQSGFNQTSGQYQQQQAQFQNQIPAHQIYNELLGPDAFKDVILDIDYGAMGGFNAAFQSGSDFSSGQLPPGISVRPAYTTMDSLHYQQHMFNTARTIHAGGENSYYDFGGTSSNYDIGGMSSNYNIGGINNAYDMSSGQNIDVAKAIFNQVDTNRDGSISRDEFRQWAQGGQQTYDPQSYSTATNYQTSTTHYGNTNDSFYRATLLDGANPAVANILQQSGLGQIVPNQ